MTSLNKSFIIFSRNFHFHGVDPYLQQFVREFTETNNGRAYYSSLDNLGEYVFEDFIKNRKKTFR